MYHRYRFLGLAVFVMLAHFSLKSQTTFKAYLSGSQEVLPTSSAGFGELTAQLTGNQLEVSGFFFDLTGFISVLPGEAAFIQNGLAGQSGSIELALNISPGANLRSGGFDAPVNTFFLSTEQVDALFLRGLYVNIHTSAFPDGEIRGQLLPASDAFFAANLLGSNEVPSVISKGYGALALELLGNQLTVSGSFSQLNSEFNTAVAGGAHIHLGLPGSNGDIQFELNPNLGSDQTSATFEAASNIFILSTDQVQALKENRLYANIHSTFQPTGELRGPVLNSKYSLFRAHLSGANQVPFVTSGASGMVVAQLFGDSLLVSGSFIGLEGEIAIGIAGGAHIHSGLAGANGGIVFSLTPTISIDQQSGEFELTNNRFALTPEQKTSLFNRGLYINIHTTAHPNGELRGQLLPEAQYVFSGFLSGAFQTPSAFSPATGAVKAELLGNKLVVSGSFENLVSDFDATIDGGAHLHIGIAGTNGAIAFPLATTTSSDLRSGFFPANLNVFTLSDDQIEQLKERRFYINIHTIDVPAGEIRSQLLGEASLYFVAPLSGASQAPTVNTPATGLAVFEVTGAEALATGSFLGLASDFAPAIAGGAHVHTGLAGQNGGITFELDVNAANDNRSGSLEALDNLYTLSAEQLFALRNRQLYVNIHSQDHPSGEIRGQLRPLAQAYLTATFAGLHEVQPQISNASGALSLELNGTELVASGSFQGLIGAFNPAISGGAHLHVGLPGQNGGININLTVNPNTDFLGGVFAASDNVFNLNADQIDILSTGRYYANVHTAFAPSGEIRGQVLPEINFYPANSPSIIMPADGAALQLEGPPSNNFEVQWSASTDLNALAYIWQVSTSADFNTLIFQTNVGNNTSFIAPYSAIDNLLQVNGISIGSTVTLYHRAIATDGSLSIVGTSAALVLTRGVVGIVQHFQARLTGHNAALPVLSLGSGSISAVLTNNELVVTGSFSGLSADLNIPANGGAHIHAGYAGQNGAVVFPLVITAGPDDRSGSFEAANNTFTLSTEEIQVLNARQWYINVHSNAATAGEIRGQILPSAEQYYSTNLFGSNEVPSLITNASGALMIERIGDQITVTGSFDNLSGDFAANISGGAHLHLGYAGQNGGIQIPLVATVDADLKGGFFAAQQNTISLNPDQIIALNTRRLYANIHTTTAANGEIRGQIVGEPLAVFRAHMAGCNETSIVTNNADGSLLVELTSDSTFVATGSFDNLESNVAVNINGGSHLHLGFAGQNGGIQFPLTPTLDADNRGGIFTDANNAFLLSPALRNALIGRTLYANVHSTEFPGGEIRGQLLPECQFVFTGILTGAMEMLPVLTGAFGAVKAELLGNQLTLSGAFRNLSGPITTANLSLGFSGQIGPLLFPLTPSSAGGGQNGVFLPSDNTFTLSNEQIGQLRARTFYVNIHSSNFNAGEIRSQLLAEANAYFVAPLSGASEAPPVRTNATGMTILEINRGRGTLTGSFSGLNSNIAVNLSGGTHIRFGLAGQLGPIIRMLNVNAAADNRSGAFRPGNNNFAVSPGLLDTLRSRSLYVNVHSINNPGGEVRGQLMPIANAYFAANMVGFNEVQPTFSTGSGALKMELRGTTLTVHGSFEGLSGASNTGASNLYLGAPGTNGSIELPLVPALSGDFTSGEIPAAVNTVELTPEQLLSLSSGSFYSSINSEAISSGELRGQSLHEINFFPSNTAAITSPPNGTALTIEGNPASTFEALWTAANDRDELAYIWQLSLTEDFSNVVFQFNVGSNLGFITDFNTIDGLLAGLGVPVGGSVQVWHRAVASDGSLFTAGDRAFVVLTRGIITGLTQPNFLGLQAKLFPTITSDELTLQVNSEQRLNTILYLVDASGRVLSQQDWHIEAGEQNLRLDASQLSAGVYFARLQLQNGNMISFKFIVAK